MLEIPTGKRMRDGEIEGDDGIGKGEKTATAARLKASRNTSKPRNYKRGNPVGVGMIWRDTIPDIATQWLSLNVYWIEDPHKLGTCPAPDSAA